MSGHDLAQRLCARQVVRVREFIDDREIGITPSDRHRRPRISRYRRVNLES